MNYKMICRTLGNIVMLEGALMLLPAVCALCYKEWKVALVFLCAAGIAALAGFAVSRLFHKCDRTIYAREGFVIVGLAWILMSLVGAAPLVLCGDIPSPVNAFFETVSGLTTTGASILTDVTALTHGGAFWRSFTHWIGGMGVLVLMMAILSDSTGRSIHIMRAEMPGPVVDKIVPRVKDTAKILYLMYIGLTLSEVVFLLFGGMSLFESLIHAFGTAGTGGFSVRPESIGAYSPYIQWVVTVFMLLFGVNFNLYYLLLLRRFRSVLRSEELHVYAGIYLVSTIIIFHNVRGVMGSTADSLRHAAFQVSSILTTTGYSSTDFNLWPGLSRTIIFILLFVGGCAGSTAGGLKISRIAILFKCIRRELRRLLHPRSVQAVRFEGKPLDEATQTGVMRYFALYSLLLAATIVLLGPEPFDLESNITAAIACFNNVGPGLSAVGPAGSYAGYSGFAKLVLSAAMLFGRLEIYPLLLTFSPLTWRRK